MFELNAINLNKSQIINNNNEFDFIIIGGGAAGSVIGGRLSEDPSIEVLVLEAGGRDISISDIPASYFYLPGSKLDWAYRTESQKNCCMNIEERRVRWARGKVLGGSSQINAMVYLRGNPNDFNNWAKNGCEGWTYNEVLPYFKKAETNYNKDYLRENNVHGDRGPLPVTSPINNPNPSAKYFISAGQDLGYKIIDFNGRTHIGVNSAQNVILNGSRVSAAKAYLESVHRDNLHIRTESFVTRINFINQTAHSVQYQSNGQTYTVTAKREIILSAGTINTPHILLLSGIGPKEHLKNMNIPIVAEVPGVGENLHDHAYVMSPSFTVSTLGPSLFSQKSFEEYYYNHSGPLAYLESPMLYIKSSFNDSNNGPDIQISMIPPLNNFYYFNGVPEKYYAIKRDVYQKYFAPYESKPSVMFTVLVAKPKSRGFLRLKSSNPYQYPILQPNYLTHPDDVQVLVDGLKMCYKMGQTNSFKRYNAKIYTTLVPGCEQFYSNYERQQLNSNNITIPSNEYLKCVVRHMTYAGLHMVGTCKMGPSSDPLSVVDPKLNVKNVKRLRVIDASIMPIITNGNTYAPTIMIGERGAQFIKDQHHLK